MSRPYFEIKVVKVKKEKEYFNQIIIDGKKYTLCKEEYLHKEKGSWVNDENIRKIKFPCFCSFKYRTETHYGIITRTQLNLNRDHYTLHSIWKQHSSYSSVKSYSELKELIENYDIHILKGKIILFEKE